MLLTVSIVMIYMIALGFEEIGMLVFDLPAGSSRLDKNLHGCSVNKMLGRTCMAIQDGPIGFCGDGEFTPMDRQGILSIPQRHLIGRPLGRDFVKATIPASEGELLAVPTGG